MVEDPNAPTVRNLNDDPHDQQVAIETSHTARKQALTTFLYNRDGIESYVGGEMPDDTFSVALHAVNTGSPAPLGSVMGDLHRFAQVLGYEVRFTATREESEATAYLRPIPDGDWSVTTDADDLLTYEETCNTTDEVVA